MLSDKISVNKLYGVVIIVKIMLPITTNAFGLLCLAKIHDNSQEII